MTLFPPTIVTARRDRVTVLRSRLQAARLAYLADPRKNEPNPLGPEYLTRGERWREVLWGLQARLEVAEADAANAWEMV